MGKKRGLGKTLDALLAYKNQQDIDHHPDMNFPPKLNQEKLSHLSIDTIQRGKYQPRREMQQEALEELANSIKSQGIIQPIIVRPVDDYFEIIAGERRFRAAQIAGLTEIPAIIRDVPDEAAMAFALIENIQRENLNPIEEALAIHRLIDEFEMTHQKIAETLGKSRTSVTNLLRLLSLPTIVIAFLEEKKLEMGHARALITLPVNLQVEAANMIVEKNLSVRDTEHLVRKLQTATNEKRLTAIKTLDPGIRDLQDSLMKRLKLKVAIHCNAKGKGKIIIHYKNLSELDRIAYEFEST